ncbi:TIR domain-containing protein [Streptomyces justiciae]|uniref:TIR domain-containing protein n=1 Tax=Streptomyces justiciae TaxID=2780140 RepID=UPI002118537A|nr:TIR domain-containing protein [Streptomyces justiciae]MCW8375359.1 toll/interleukin-1 receptor domain-containing protein [Streptomyces justiciae]
MSGVFINYRRGGHSGVVDDLDAALARHFGREQVFLDRPSLLPGQRFADALAERVADCDALIAVLHPGWADARHPSGARRLSDARDLSDVRPLSDDRDLSDVRPLSDDRHLSDARLPSDDRHLSGAPHLSGASQPSGARRLDDPEDWVRREIEWALAGGKFVLPVLLDGAEMPTAAELPDSLRALAGLNAPRLRTAHWTADLAVVIAALEGVVRPDWRPVDPPEERGARLGGRWLAALTGVVAGTVLVGVPLLPQDDDWVGTDVLPYTLTAALMCCLLLCAPLIAVAAVRVVRRSVDDLERELHTVRHRTYLRRTWPIGLGLVLVGVYGAFRGDLGMLRALVLLLVLGVAVARAAAADIRLRRRDDDLWARWPHRLPDRVNRAEQRRAVARLHLRLDRMTAPLSREQREKAGWELDDIAGAVRRVAREAGRTRGVWLRRDHPWLFALYTVWLALIAALAVASGRAFADAGEGTVRRYVTLAVVVLIGVLLALGTLEIAYRYQRRQRRELARQIGGYRESLAARVAGMSLPARAKATAPAPRPEEYAEPE